MSESASLRSRVRNDFLDLPDVIADASRHRRGAWVGASEAHVGPREVVVHEVQGHGTRLDLTWTLQIGKLRGLPARGCSRRPRCQGFQFGLGAP